MSRRALLRLAGIGVSGAVVATGTLLRGTVLAQSTDATPAPPPPPGAHWSYEGEAGPANWGELDDRYEACSRGTAQSPIDIDESTGKDLPDIEFAYNTIPSVHLTNNGHTVQISVAAGNGITLDGVWYELIQFHFHTPSEHTIAGQAQAMEMHLVHVAQDTSIAVVGVLLQEGAEHAGLASIFAAMPRDDETEADISEPLDLSTLLPATRTTYRYMGSLTTPPCDEGVRWLVFTQPDEVSAEQVAAFRAIFAHDARPIQPSNDRVIVEDTSA